MFVKVVKVFVNYCYLIVGPDSGSCIIVDPAWSMHSVTRYIETESLELEGILLTHHHFDHTNMADALARRYDAPVRMSGREIDYYGFACKNLVPVPDDSTFEIGDITVTAYATPGHTKGSVCYLAGDFLFTGDTLFSEGCGACSFEGGDPSEMYRSLARLKRIARPDTIIYPSHSYGKTPGMRFDEVLKSNIYLQIEDEALFVKYRMRKGQSGWFNFK